ncbi:MAG: thioredoxin [Bacteroidia bacterium]|nr:thioredoxin [Bacteroidia bacterium]
MKTFEQLIAAEKPVLVDFYADWCAPCKMMPPILREVKDELGDQVAIIKIDVDKNPQVAAAYQVRGIPTLIVFKNGQVQWRTSGVIPAPQLKQKLLEFTQ